MKQITITKEQLVEMLQMAKTTIAKDDTRPILTYIKIEVTAQEISAVSLDGYMLSKISYNHNQTTEPFSFVIKPFEIPTDLINAIVEQNGDSVNITLKCSYFDITYSFKQPDSEYINYEKILPTTSKNLTISFDAVRLIKILKPFTKSRMTRNCVRLSFVEKDGGINRNRPVTLTAKSDDGATKYALLLSLRRDSE